MSGGRLMGVCLTAAALSAAVFFTTAAGVAEVMVFSAYASDKAVEQVYLGAPQHVWLSLIHIWLPMGKRRGNCAAGSTRTWC